MHCKHFMQGPIVTATVHDTVAFAARLMRESRVGIIPVVDDGGHLMGTITERDIVRDVVGLGLGTDLKLSLVAKRPVRCALRDSLTVAEAKMVQQGIDHVVVCDDAGIPRGVIGVMDLARNEDPRVAATVFFRLAAKEARS